jgi:hypothetical protein
MPQFKVRSHEIASSKSLMLVKKDPWNLVEDFYEPDKEFLYFENFDELKDMIHDISLNFYKYNSIIEAAFKRSHDYTVEKLYRYIQTNDSSLITWRNKNVCR